MKTTFKTAISTVSLFFLSGQILAATPLLDKRQNNQQARIAQGVKSGELTRKEARRMIKGQMELQHLENRVEADGVVTKKESAVLQHKANVESARIAYNKHDSQQRPKANN